jgi:hypothetical protein
MDTPYDKTPDGIAERRENEAFEKHFRSHRDLPNGRNFRWWNADQSPEADRKYRKNFDAIFPNSPGAGI